MSYDQTARDYSPRSRIEQSYASSGVMSQREEGERQRSAHMRDEAMRGALSPEPKQRSSGLQYQLECLNKSVASMEEAFDRLTSRLSPFMCPVPEQSWAHNSSQGPHAQSPLSEQVERITEQVERLSRGINYLTEGVDL